MSVEREPRFYWPALVERGDLSLGARMAYVTLARFADADGECHPSLSALQKALGGAPRRSVMRWLAELEAAGAIKPRTRSWWARPGAHRLPLARLRPHHPAPVA